MTEPQYNVAYYREQAEEARQSASKALTRESRDGYLKLAADWEKLADDIEAGTVSSRRTG